VNASDASIARAVEALRAGALVAFPTETVYGLGADAASSRAITCLYDVKGRPRGHPVIVHVHSVDALDDVGRDVPAWARDLASTCWPGPLTLVVPRRAGAVCDEVTGGRDTVGVRVPNHPVALELLRAFGGGVAAPSANRFGRVSPTTAAHVRDDLGDDVAVVLDGGPSAVGVESTIVDATSNTPRILRHGAVDPAAIARITGREPTTTTDGTIAAPGTLASHYAPRARVVLADDLAAANETARRHARTGCRVGLLAMHTAPAPRANATDASVTMLDAPADAQEYAHVLYARLREADARGLDVLVVVPPPPLGVGAAVVDRLQRAATVDGDAERGSTTS
jgi:L-threonylcarbamoyladenylate synthase